MNTIIHEIMEKVVSVYKKIMVELIEVIINGENEISEVNKS